MGWSLSLGSISGIRIRIHFTFLALLAWVGISAAQSGGREAGMEAMAFIVLLFACVVAHEFGHIFMARRFGAMTEDVVLLPIGGVARMRNIPEKPSQELLVALAGPAVNVVIFAVLLAALGPAQLLHDLDFAGNAPLPLLTQLAVSNLVLAIFNLLPAFPMDGGRALRALLALRFGRITATRWAVRIGHFLAAMMGAYGLLSGNPMLMLVAAFIYFGASSEASGAQLHAITHGLRLRDAMLTRLGVVGPQAVLADAIDLLVHSTQHDIPVLDGVGKPIGLLTREALALALHAHGSDFPVLDTMQQGLPALPAGASLEDALGLIEQGATAVAAIDPTGALIGLVTPESLGHLMLLHRHKAR